MLFRCVVAVAVSLALFASHAEAADWTQFRGPDGNAVVTTESTPTTFATDNTLWKTDLPGIGWSSPVCANGLIWLTTAETTAATEEQIAAKTRGVQFAQIKTAAANVKLRAICVNAESGVIVHNILLRNIDEPDLINPLNSYASPTAAISVDRVVCHFGNYGTWCLKLTTGKILWNNALVVDHSVGPGSSPVIVDDIVLLVCDGIDQQFVAGLHLGTGKKAWKTPRPPMRADNGEFRKAYSTPLVIKVDGQVQAVIPGAQWMCAYNPTTGDEIWRADCGKGFSTTPMAIYEAGVVICSTGFMKPELVGINPSGSGDITKSNILWRSRQGGSTMPTAIGHGGKVYSISDAGVLAVLDATSGKMLKQMRIGGKFAASPLLAGRKLYLPAQDGTMTVIDSGDYRSLAVNSMNGDLMASPAVLGSDLVVRTSKSLLRLKAER